MAEPFSVENREGVALEENEVIRGGEVCENAGPWVGRAVGNQRFLEDIFSKFSGRDLGEFCEEEEIFLGGDRPSF